MFKFFKKNYNRAKNLLARYTLTWPKKVKCNICNWTGRRFKNDFWHPQTVCPRCYSQVRHRLLVSALDHIDKLRKENIIKNRKILHFAPHPAIKKYIKGLADEYVTADYIKEEYDLQLDITDMHSIEDGSYDVLIACDVLEHVKDDNRAAREIYRVLSPGGVAILTVPQKDGLEKTIEDKNIKTETDRIKAYGQWDHVRLYGNDFIKILENTNFKVQIVTGDNFTNEQVNKNVLFPPVLSNNPLATNYRKVFFAKKI